MKFKLVWLTLAIFCSVLGVSKGEKKLKKLYDKQKFEKCQSVAKKLIYKDKSSGFAHLFLAKSNLKLVSSYNSINKQKQLLVSGVKSYRLAEKNQVRDRDFYYDELLPAYESFCLSKLEKQDINKAIYMAKNLAKHMRDTLSFYRVYLVQLQQAKTQNTIVNFSSNLDFEDSIRNALLRYAETLQGIPYSYGGESKKGFDCSGFTKYVYSSIGVEIPHNAQLQSELGKHKTLENAKPGDLVFFGHKRGTGYRAIHAGIIYENQEADSAVIHCVSSGVALEGKNSSWDRYWKNKVLFVSDLLSEESCSITE